VIQTLDVRAGMTLAAGQTLAQVTGIGTVWLNAAVPEAQAGAVRIGQAQARRWRRFRARPSAGRVIAILPDRAGR
jgi:Cu(I)/Ag(I) efflux system membrane fusion protein